MELMEPVMAENQVVADIRRILKVCEASHGARGPNAVQQFGPGAPVRLCVYWKKAAVGLKVLGRD